MLLRLDTSIYFSRLSAIDRFPSVLNWQGVHNMMVSEGAHLVPLPLRVVGKHVCFQLFTIIEGRGKRSLVHISKSRFTKLLRICDLPVALLSTKVLTMMEARNIAR